MRAARIPSFDVTDDTKLPIGRRAAPRLRLCLPARLVTLSDTRPCVLIDLSRSGAQVGLEKPQSEGADVILQIHTIDHFGTVMRSAMGHQGGLNGIKFEEQLTDDQVIAMRHYAESFEYETNRNWRSEVEAWVSGLI